MTEVSLRDEAASAQAFISWARTALKPVSIPDRDNDYADMAFLTDVVSGKRVVALGESAHYLHEWNRWRTRLFKYLALHHGFSVFVLESGLIEGRRVHDYVAGADIEWDEVAAAITNGWGVWAELNELIRWMRDWNLDPERPRELRFYGMDGTGNWSHARRAFKAVHEFARRVDTDLAERLSRDFAQAVEDVSFETRDQIQPTQLQDLVSHASALVIRLRQERPGFCAATSPDDYDWALRSAQILHDVFLCIAKTEPDFDVGLHGFWSVRDESMAQSLQWIRQREGLDAGVVVGAHNTHLQQYPVRVQRLTSMGSYFSNRYGRDDSLYIGAASALSLKGEQPSQDCNQAVYERVGPDCFFLDLREAPTEGPVAGWLVAERPDRSNLRYQPVAPGRAWDCLLFHRTLSLAQVDLPGYLKVDPGTVSREQLQACCGRYVIDGFLGAVNTLDVYLEDGALCTSGSDDTSGELFPPYAVPLHIGEDGRFRWHTWPAVVEFHRGNRSGELSIDMPGMGIYHGQRVGEATVR